MSTPIPPPLRAAAGLAAMSIDAARKLPEQLVGLPVLAVSTALQVSLRAQQRYAELVARGDEVLAQLRGVEEAPPWARFDDEPGASARSMSAFDAAPAPGPRDEPPLDELAADQLGGGEPEADLLADAEGGYDGGPVLEPDGVTATEAEAGGLDVGEVPLRGLAPAADLPGGGDIDGSLPVGGATDGSPPVGGGTDASLPVGGSADQGGSGSGTEPGVDLPAGEVTDLAEDAEAVEDALAEDAEAVVDALAEADAAGSADDAMAGPVAGPDDALAGAGAGRAPADPTAGLDGYLAVEPPIARYDELSIPQLRGRLRSLSAAQIEELIAYERATTARPPYLTMLENRLVTLRSR